MSQILNYCFKSRKHCLSRYILNLKILGPPLISKAPPSSKKRVEPCLIGILIAILEILMTIHLISDQNSLYMSDWWAFNKNC